MFTRKLLFMLIASVGVISRAEEPPPEEAPNPCVDSIVIVTNVLVDAAFNGPACSDEYKYEMPDTFPFELEGDPNSASYSDATVEMTVSEDSEICEDSESDLSAGDTWQEDVAFTAETWTDPAQLEFETNNVLSYVSKAKGVADGYDDVGPNDNGTTFVAIPKVDIGTENIWLGVDSTDDPSPSDWETVQASVSSDHDEADEPTYTWTYQGPFEIDSSLDVDGDTLGVRWPVGEGHSSAYSNDCVKAKANCSKTYNAGTETSPSMQTVTETTLEVERKLTVAKINLFVSGENCTEYSEETPGVFIAVNDTGEYRCGVSLRPYGIPEEFNLVNLDGGSGVKFYRSGNLVTSINADAYKPLRYNAAPGLHTISVDHAESGANDKANVHIIKAEIVEDEYFSCSPGYAGGIGCNYDCQIPLTADSYSPSGFEWEIEPLISDGASVDASGKVDVGCLSETYTITVKSKDLEEVYDTARLRVVAYEDYTFAASFDDYDGYVERSKELANMIVEAAFNEALDHLKVPPITFNAAAPLIAVREFNTCCKVKEMNSVYHYQGMRTKNEVSTTKEIPLVGLGKNKLPEISADEIEDYFNGVGELVDAAGELVTDEATLDILQEMKDIVGDASMMFEQYNHAFEAYNKLFAFIDTIPGGLTLPLYIGAKSEGVLFEIVSPCDDCNEGRYLWTGINSCLLNGRVELSGLAIDTSIGVSIKVTKRSSKLDERLLERVEKRAQIWYYLPDWALMRKRKKQYLVNRPFGETASKETTCMLTSLWIDDCQ